MRWIVGIALAAVAGTVAYTAGAGPEVAYVIRAVVRHLVGYH